MRIRVQKACMFVYGVLHWQHFMRFKSKESIKFTDISSRTIYITKTSAVGF